MSLTDEIINMARIFFPSVNTKCLHEKIRPDVEQAYCPDCGKLVRNEWYVTRCACCGVKMKTMITNGKIVPQNHYCSNCGSEEFTVEKVKKINFIDINFAALVRKEIEEQKIYSSIKCWQEKTPEQPKLLAQYL